MKRQLLIAVTLLTSMSLFQLSCSKSDSDQTVQTSKYTSDVVIKWLDMQLNLLRVPLAAGAGTVASERSQGYCGIVAYEAVVPGMQGYQSLFGQLTDFPAMPTVEAGKAYHWAASSNAALAEINRKLFTTASPENKTAIDNLENSLRLTYAGETDAATLDRSIAFGKEVATRVAAWAATDVAPNTCSYTDPTPADLIAKPWLWLRTSPTAAAINPCASYQRLFVPDVANGTTLDPPPTYSTVVGSPFYNMVKDVYDKQNAATPDQLASAVYYRDAPGYPGGGAFVSIYSQILSKAKSTLDVAALGYAKVGIAQHDATLICFTNKYNFLLVRPVTYIKQYIDPTWNTYIPTPNHPEFPSGHATINSAVTTMFADVFVNSFPITLHTYDYLVPALPARSFNTFEEMSVEMANSRVYGGLHYQATCDKSRVQGKKVATNILAKIKFKK